ncbi:MAG: hypothetical protein ACE5KV_01560 [Thermoplasmata archaeon]
MQSLDQDYPRKIYATDNGIASITGRENIGNLYENAVAVELLREGKKPLLETPYRRGGGFCC